jgi:hypothetical protein
MDVKPGSKVTVEITGLPTSAAAQKTLARVCRKDPVLVRQQRYADRHRPSWQTWRRGGRLWHHQMFSTPGVDFTPGTKYSVPATLDVIRDLASVQRWIKVTTA